MSAGCLRDCLHAEWTKVRTLPGTFWLLAGVVVLTAVVGAVTAAAVSCPAAGCGQDPARLSLTGVELGQAVAAIVAVLAVAGEYSTGMIRVTLAAAPRRGTVLAAKALIVTGLVLAAGTVGVLASMLAGRLILPGRGLTPAHGYPPLSLTGPDLRAAAGSVLYLGLVALLALGLAVAIRDPAVAIGSALGLLYLFPVVATALDPDWRRHLEQIGPMSAGLDIQATTRAALGSQALGPWAGLGVLALWALGAMLLGGLLFRLRDA
ncbi:MAG: ABC transporter permease [Streptosporangiaceae bacterium]